MNKVNLFNLDIDNITLEETTEKIFNSIKNNQFIVREDLNAVKVVRLKWTAMPYLHAFSNMEGQICAE